LTDLFRNIKAKKKRILFAILILVILWVSNIGRTSVDKAKYMINVKQAQNSAYQNYKINKDKIKELQEKLEDVSVNFSISLWNESILIEKFDPMSEFENQNSSYFGNANIKPLYNLKQLVPESNHPILSKMGAFNVSFNHHNKVDFEQSLLKEFSEENEGFLDFLQILDFSDCKKVIKQNDCIYLSHKNISRFEDPFFSIFCGNFLLSETYFDFGYQLGNCEDEMAPINCYYMVQVD